MVKHDTVLLETKETQNRQTTAAFLHQLADKVAEGRVILRQGTDEVILELPPEWVLEIKVEQKERPTYTKQKLELEFSWREGDTAVVDTVTLG